MKRSFTLALSAITTLTLAYAAEKSEWWQYKAFKGAYLIYSNQLGEERPPTASDRKISFAVSGPLAKEMFDSMYPDVKVACSLDKDFHQRIKGNISCVHDRDGYTCHFGFNLRTGASISGATC
ncbi:hypothetical protein [Massilia horti]|uniref:Uncharacterized protein n=1 Tax=Massilia horti TaxID=2562153 RepID=A0A4Y9SXH8_9BURK|nr:hypothetical protein [Massilia horti]TFW31124.1 hypothetical protein E4O92_14575 [Massilia horti]